MDTCDYLVIGAGIAGASAGYELAAEGRVVVLEREHAPGYHSTGRSAALYLETYGEPVIRALTIASRPFFISPPASLVEYPVFQPRGVLWIGTTEQLRELEEAYSTFRRQVKTIRRVSAKEARTLCPVLRKDYVAGGVLEPDAMDLDVDAIHQVFLRGLRARGGEVRVNAEVTAVARKDGGWVAETPDGAYAAPVLVNAAGAWCDVVARLAGLQPLGLRPLRRTAFTIDPPSGSDITRWPAVADVEEAFYFKPEASRLLASPADETPVAPCDARPEDLDVAVAVERLERATTLEVRRVTRRWAGLRTFAPDRVPVVGMDPEGEGFFWLAGQGGYGIMTAPAMARLSLALITGRGVPEDLAALGVSEEEVSPARFHR
jgi:D-arginine dehydrogenase